MPEGQSLGEARKLVRILGYRPWFSKVVRGLWKVFGLGWTGMDWACEGCGPLLECSISKDPRSLIRDNTVRQLADFGCWERGTWLARIELGLAQIGKPGGAQVLVGSWKFPVSVHLAVLPQEYLLFEPLSLFDPCPCAQYVSWGFKTCYLKVWFWRFGHSNEHGATWHGSVQSKGNKMYVRIC